MAYKSVRAWIMGLATCLMWCSACATTRTTQSAPHAPDAVALFNKAVAFERTGEVVKALEYYKKAQVRDAGFVPPRYNLARLLLKLGKLEDAQHTCTELRALYARYVKKYALKDPRLAGVARWGQAHTFLLQGSHQDAMAHYMSLTQRWDRNDLVMFPIRMQSLLDLATVFANEPEFAALIEAEVVKLYTHYVQHVPINDVYLPMVRDLAAEAHYRAVVRGYEVMKPLMHNGHKEASLSALKDGYYKVHRQIVENRLRAQRVLQLKQRRWSMLATKSIGDSYVFIASFLRSFKCKKTSTECVKFSTMLEEQAAMTEHDAGPHYTRALLLASALSTYPEELRAPYTWLMRHKAFNPAVRKGPPRFTSSFAYERRHPSYEPSKKQEGWRMGMLFMRQVTR